MNFSKSTRLPLWSLIALGFAIPLAFLLGSYSQKHCVLRNDTEVGQAFDLITQSYEAEFTLAMYQAHDQIVQKAQLTREDSISLVRQVKAALELIIGGYRGEHISSRLVTKSGTPLKDLMERVAPGVFQCDVSQLTFATKDQLPDNATTFDMALVRMRDDIFDKRMERETRAKYATTDLVSAKQYQLWKILSILETEEGY